MRFIALELRNHYVRLNFLGILFVKLILFLDKCSRSFDEKFRKNKKTTISTNKFNVLKKKKKRIF
jgi:hypothetical protein